MSTATSVLKELIGDEQADGFAIKPSDIEALSEEERNAEIVNKEKAARIYERLCNQLIKQRKDEHELRKKFMPFVYWLVVGVIGSTILMLAAAGIVNACGKTFLSDKVLITLLTATVADILGIFYIAIRWLYPKQRQS